MIDRPAGSCGSLGKGTDSFQADGSPGAGGAVSEHRVPPYKLEYRIINNTHRNMPRKREEYTQFTASASHPFDLFHYTI